MGPRHTPTSCSMKTRLGQVGSYRARQGTRVCRLHSGVARHGPGNQAKIRGEDCWRRSPTTPPELDVPHHNVGDFVTMAKRMSTEDADIHALDLLNAYRQWPVRQPSHNATFLHTRHGLTLWFHMAMCFGAAASVWNFNRVADALQLIARMLLLVVGGHYVDDFNGFEYAEHAHNAFHAFSDLFHVLGLRVKESKAQPPQRQHVLQGVDVQVQDDGVTLSPTTRRVQKLQHAIRQALANDCLTPREASR